MSNQVHLILAAAFIGLTAIPPAPAAAKGWLEKSTGIRTPEPIRKIAPNGISIRRRESTSYFGTSSSEETIANDGAIWERHHRDGRTGKWYRTKDRARLERNSQGLAWWVYQGASNSPRRAPNYDRRTTHKIEINPNTGAVQRLTYVGQTLQRREHVTTVPVQYNDQGRPYFAYGSTWVFANRPNRSQQTQYRQGSHTYHGSGAQQNAYRRPNSGYGNQQYGRQADPGAQVAAGILQIIGGAMQSGR